MHRSFGVVIFSLAHCQERRRQQEGRSQTRARAEEFVRLLCKEKRDAVVITHGFYMHMLLKAFKYAGFRVRKTHVHYRNGEYVLVEKDL